MDNTMPVAEDLYDEELTLFKKDYEELHTLQLKITKLHTSRLYGLNKKQQFQH